MQRLYFLQLVPDYFDVVFGLSSNSSGETMFLWISKMKIQLEPFQLCLNVGYGAYNGLMMRVHKQD